MGIPELMDLGNAEVPESLVPFLELGESLKGGALMPMFIFMNSMKRFRR